MTRVAKIGWLPGLLVLASFWLAFSNSSLGDFTADAAPAVAALSHLQIASYLSAQPLMGPFSTLVEAPFAALGTSPLTSYQWASVPCLLAAAGLGLYLGRCAARRGGGEATRTLIPLLCVVNPLTIQALQLGHPEEILTAALAVGAVAVAAEGHDRGAAVLLGLAIVSKQWAVIAIFPTLMALPGRRLRAIGIALAVALAFSLPELVANSSSFFGVQSRAADGGRIAGIWSAWYPFSPLSAGGGAGATLTAQFHEIPAAIRPLTHVLVVGTSLFVPLALWARRGRFGLDGGDAMALLCLLALLRCVLDPANNLYYHVPLLVALFGWDALSPGRLPLRGLAGAALALLFYRWSRELGDLTLFNAGYLLVLGSAAVAIAMQLAARRREASAPRAAGNPQVA